MGRDRGAGQLRRCRGLETRSRGQALDVGDRSLLDEAPERIYILSDVIRQL
jgi:hypothetical protein